MENKNLSFEEAMQRLEDIVNELEKEGITLENAMEKFEEGVKPVSYTHLKKTDKASSPAESKTVKEKK